jgi:flagellar protein FlbD
MIYVTRLNHASVVLNCELIEHIETTPDTVISLTTGQKLMVLESADEIVARVVQYRRSIQAGIGLGSRAQPLVGDVAGTATGAETHGGR